MRLNPQLGARAALVAGTFVAGVAAWTFTRPDASTVDIPLVVDAGIDAAVDAANDAPPAPTDWTMVTIASAASTGLTGSDGVDIATIGGKLTVVSPWEQSGTITISTLSAGTWTTATVSTVVSVEDAKFCDVDGDGDQDIIAGGQGRRIRIWFGPAPWSSDACGSGACSEEIDAATNLQQWLQLACTTSGGVRIWAGGREDPAYVGYFTSATPRDSASWTFTQVAQVSWLMSVIPRDVDGDGDLDVIISDRLAGQSNKGTRWFEDDGSWTKHTIHNSNNEGDPKFAELVGADTVLVGMSSNTKPNKLVKSVTADSGDTWTTTTITPYPDSVGQYQGVETCDLTGDGTDDYVLTHATATGDLSGVVAYNGATGARIEIDHAAGEKYDNAICNDVDGDGDLDVITSEQNVGLGVVWFKNPRL